MSPYTPWSDYSSSGPIAVEGGVKAKSKRGAIGEQWWSRRFIAVLESYGAGMSGRLQRGKNYARRGQVIEFSLGAGKVAARVQGSRPQPYRVTITVAPLTTAQWREVESRLAAQALFRARLLAGEMPAEIEQVFADAGTPLFPASGRDLTMDCNCPDWGVPCKHLAAVCYVLAEAFDDDPFAMLAWRGRTRAELLAALRGKGAGRAAGLAPSDRPARRPRPTWCSGSATRLRSRSADSAWATCWPRPTSGWRGSRTTLLSPDRQSLNASLAFSPACFGSPATWSFCPSAAMFGSLVCSPAACLPSPINFWAAFLALSMKLMPFASTCSFLRTMDYVEFPHVGRARGCYTLSIHLITRCEQNAHARLRAARRSSRSRSPADVKVIVRRPRSRAARVFSAR